MDVSCRGVASPFATSQFVPRCEGNSPHLRRGFSHAGLWRPVGSGILREFVAAIDWRGVQTSVVEELDRFKLGIDALAGRMTFAGLMYFTSSQILRASRPTKKVRYAAGLARSTFSLRSVLRRRKDSS